MSAPELKRVLRLPAVAFIAIGFTIGGGVFVLTGIVLKIAGSALPIAYVLAVFPVFISMLPIAMLGSAIPTTGANYKYPSRMVSPGIAFVSIWVYAVASFGGQIPLYALGCAKYIQVYFPGLSLPLAAIGILTFIYIVNLLGVKLAAQVQGIFVIIWIFSIAGIGSGLSLKTLASYAALGALMILIPIQIAAIRLPKLHPERYQRAAFKLTGFWLWFCPSVGILMVVFFSILIIYDLKSPLKIRWLFDVCHIGRALLSPAQKISLFDQPQIGRSNHK